MTSFQKNVPKVRHYCFTINNYTLDDLNNIALISLEKIKYIIYGKEIAPNTGTPHLQGYIELNTPQRMSYVKKLLNNNSVHLEARKGTKQQAIEYCKKDGDYHQLGLTKITDKVIKKQGQRNDILCIWAAIKSGYSQSLLLETYPIEYVKYGKAIDKYYTLNEPGRSRETKPEIIWHYGPTGTNKTRTVYEQENDDVFIPKNFKWWDGYDRNNIVLLDDFRPDYCKFHELITLLDRYQYKLEVKGGMRQLVATKIYITSPYHPQDIYKNRTVEDIKQLTRRITSIIHFPYENEEPLSFNDNLNQVIDDNTDDIDSDSYPWEIQHKHTFIDL